MSRIFEDRAYQADSLNGCFWAEDFPGDSTWDRLEGNHTAEVAVIGAGYTGLSAALHLAGAGVDVAVLDMHDPGWGASGRNGGFCCMGGAMSGEGSLTRRFGAEGYSEWDTVQKDAVALVADLLNSHGIDAQTHSKGETVLAHSRGTYRWLEQEANAMARAGELVEFIATEDLAGKGMRTEGLLGGYTEPIGFALHPRRYVLGLAQAVLKAGGRIFTGASVDRMRVSGDAYELRTASGTLTAKRVVIATNGYSNDDLPGWMRARYMPAQSNIIVTRQLTEEEIAAQGWTTDQMVYDTRNLLHYFRLLPDRRMMFGMRGGILASERADRKMHRMIRRDFEAMFPEWRHVETPWFWTGLVCLTRARVPFVGKVPDTKGVYAGFGWHGNGVAMGTYAGRLLAHTVLGKAGGIPAVMRDEPGRIPFGSMRRGLLPPIYAGLGLLDRIS